MVRTARLADVARAIGRSVDAVRKRAQRSGAYSTIDHTGQRQRRRRAGSCQGTDLSPGHPAGRQRMDTMSDTKRSGGARDGRWPPDPEFPSNWWRGSRWKRALQRKHRSDRALWHSLWELVAWTKRENNRVRRAAGRVALREAVSEAEAERSIETAEAADGRAAEGAARHPTGMSGDRGR